MNSKCDPFVDISEKHICIQNTQSYTEIMRDMKIPQNYDYLSVVKIMLAEFSPTGEFYGYFPLKNQIQLCGTRHYRGNLWKQFGNNFYDKCTVNVTSLGLRLYEPLLYLENLNLLYPIPVLPKNYKVNGISVNNNENNKNQYQFLSRFFMYDNYSTSKIQYASEISFVFEVQDENHQEIHVPYLIVDYKPVENINQLQDFKFSVIYLLTNEDFMTFTITIIIVFIILGVAYFLARVFIKVHTLVADGMNRYVIFTIVGTLFDGIAAATFLLCFVMGFYLLCGYKWTPTLNLCLESTDKYFFFSVFTWISLICKLIGTLFSLLNQSSGTIQIIDWEPSDHENRHLSMSRFHLVANEWMKLSTIRGFDVSFILVFVLFIVRGMKTYLLSQPIPNTNRINAGRDYAIIQIGLTAFIWFLSILIFWILKRFVYWNIFGNPYARFVNLCLSLNVSVLMMMSNTRGFYIHGKQIILNQLAALIDGNYDDKDEKDTEDLLNMNHVSDSSSSSSSSSLSSSSSSTSDSELSVRKKPRKNDDDSGSEALLVIDVNDTENTEPEKRKVEKKKKSKKTKHHSSSDENSDNSRNENNRKSKELEEEKPSNKEKKRKRKENRYIKEQKDTILNVEGWNLFKKKNKEDKDDKTEEKTVDKNDTLKDEKEKNKKDTENKKAKKDKSDKPTKKKKDDTKKYNSDNKESQTNEAENNEKKFEENEKDQNVNENEGKDKVKLSKKEQKALKKQKKKDKEEQKKLEINERIKKEAKKEATEQKKKENAEKKSKKKDKKKKENGDSEELNTPLNGKESDNDGNDNVTDATIVTNEEILKSQIDDEEENKGKDSEEADDNKQNEIINNIPDEKDDSSEKSVNSQLTVSKLSGQEKEEKDNDKITSPPKLSSSSSSSSSSPKQINQKDESSDENEIEPDFDVSISESESEDEKVDNPKETKDNISIDADQNVNIDMDSEEKREKERIEKIIQEQKKAIDTSSSMEDTTGIVKVKKSSSYSDSDVTNDKDLLLPATETAIKYKFEVIKPSDDESENDVSLQDTSSDSAVGIISSGDDQSLSLSSHSSSSSSKSRSSGFTSSAVTINSQVQKRIPEDKHHVLDPLKKNSDKCQVFEVFLEREFYHHVNKYNLLIDTVMANDKNKIYNEEIPSINEIDEETNKLWKRILTSKSDPYHFQVEKMSMAQIMFGMGPVAVHESVFTMQNVSSFKESMLYGIEGSLMLFYLIIFICIEMVSNASIAGLVVFIVDAFVLKLFKWKRRSYLINRELCVYKSLVR